MLHSGSFLVVEGVDDMKFWRTRCHDACRLVDGGGKPNVVNGMTRLDETDFKGALAVVDSNHDHLAGSVLKSRNIVATDAHDLECLLCRSSALDAVLAEFGDPDKIEQFEREHTDVRTALVDRAVVLGSLRWAARQFRPNIGLAGIKLPRFMNETTWALDEQRMIAAASSSQVGETALRQAIAALPAVEPWYVARGHDVLEILRMGLRQVLGSLQANVGVAQLAAVLRQGMPPPELQSTKL